MGKVGLVLNGVVLTGVLTLLLVDAGAATAPVLSAPDQRLVEIESAAVDAADASTVGALVSAYLDRQQPGLAQAVLDRHPELDGADLAIARSRVALARGDIDEARQQTALALATCDAPNAAPCSASLVGRALQQTSYLDSLESAGVVDPVEHPVAARAALAESRREVVLAAF
jgi:hypothetical protein